MATLRLESAASAEISGYEFVFLLNPIWKLHPEVLIARDLRTNCSNCSLRGHPSGTCLLVRQWRAGAAFNGDDGFLIEACAGLLDADDPKGCVKREAMESLKSLDSVL